MNQPMEHVMRQSLIALRLAEQLGLDEADASCSSPRAPGPRAAPTRRVRRCGPHTINRLGRERLFGWMLRSALRAVEKAER
jgi:hypothetical protein